MVTVPPDPNASDLTDIELSGLWPAGSSIKNRILVIQNNRRLGLKTLGYGLVDSPSGQAAWIVEKFYQWMTAKDTLENVVSRDELLDDIMVYWLNGVGASSARLYWESFGSKGQQLTCGRPHGRVDFP